MHVTDLSSTKVGSHLKCCFQLRVWVDSSAPVTCSLLPSCSPTASCRPWSAMSVPRTRTGCTPSATTSTSWQWIQRRLHRWNLRYEGVSVKGAIVAQPWLSEALEAVCCWVLQQLHPCGALPLLCLLPVARDSPCVVFLSAWLSVKNWNSVLYIVGRSNKLRGLELGQYQFCVSIYQAPLKFICWGLGCLDQTSSLLPSVYVFPSLGLFFIL